MKFTRMLICESLADAQVQEIIDRMQEYVRTIPDVIDHSILAEEDGRMVILITDWKSREACLQHHTSRSNRQFVADTQHLLVGSYVVKLFQNHTERRDVHESRNT
jgi:quinol monooxygenase YgiN